MAHKYASAGEITEAILANALHTNTVRCSERKQRNCLWGGTGLIDTNCFPTKNSKAAKLLLEAVLTQQRPDASTAVRKGIFKKYYSRR